MAKLSAEKKRAIEVGRLLKMTRKAKGLTLEQLAAILGPRLATIQTLSRMERGEIALRAVERFVALCDALDLTFNDKVLFYKAARKEMGHDGEKFED